MGGSPRISSYSDAQHALRSVRRSDEAFTYSDQATQSGRGKLHPNLNIKGKRRECFDTDAMPNITAIVIGMDVTRSRGNDAKVVYEQLMPMLGALHLSGAVTDPQLLLSAIGDAKNDRAPLQIGQFESDDRMDDDLSRMWLEEGGGGTGEESYELFAYAIARKTDVHAYTKRGQKGFCFITGDEAPYPTVSASEVKRHIGDELDGDISTVEIFAELQKQYHTFLLYPGKSMEERKDDIDAEIRQRLLKAGGRFQNVSIRASLIWNTYDDLDLHVITPDNDHIYFSHRRSSCGGELDVDRNAGGRETREPVENIRWAKGAAKPGKYHVFVRNFSHHETVQAPIPFAVELDLDGKIQRFEGEAKKGITGPDSDITAFEFDYSPEEAVAANDESRESYADETILAKWRDCIPDGNIIRLPDAKLVTEAMIGVMAIQRGVLDLDGVVASMHERAVDDSSIEKVKDALRPFVAQGVFASADESVFPE